MSNDRSITEKVIKLLRLSESSEAHEAALALKRARELMEKHGISSSDLKVAEIVEKESVISIMREESPSYINALADMVATHFSCDFMWSRYVRGDNSRIYRPVFVGAPTEVEVCTYAFEVLMRKLNRQKEEFLVFGRPASDLQKENYCLAWVAGVYHNVQHLVPERPRDSSMAGSQELIAIDPLKAYINQQAQEQVFAEELPAIDNFSQTMGFHAGMQERINKGLSHTENTMIDG